MEDKSNFTSTKKCINNSNDLDSFKKSESYAEIINFVKICADSVVGIKISDNYVISSNINKIVAFLDKLYDVIQDIPPLTQPMRFGNRAFKIFHSRLCIESLLFATELLQNKNDVHAEVNVEKTLADTTSNITSHTAANNVEISVQGSADSTGSTGINVEVKLQVDPSELSSYLNGAFGNETRIDYGTGHELSFVLFLLCLFKLDIIKKDDFSAVVLRCFTAYIRVMRRLQQDYLLEPAGRR